MAVIYCKFVHWLCKVRSFIVPRPLNVRLILAYFAARSLAYIITDLLYLLLLIVLLIFFYYTYGSLVELVA